MTAPAPKAQPKPPPKQVSRPPISKSNGVGQIVSTVNAGMSIAQAGRVLFGDGSAPNLSATQIMGILKTFGVQIPKGVQVTVDVAQAVVAGAAIANDINTGASLGAYVAPTVAGIRAIEGILAVTGALPKDEATRENLILLNSGLDVAMLIASAGTNVVAWADLAVNLYSTSQLGSMLTAKANSEAQQNMQEWYAARVNAEHSAIIQNIADYSAGKIDTFDFIDKIGQQSPDFFLNVFPNFAPDVKQYLHTNTFSVTESSSFAGVNVANGSGSAQVSYVSVDYSRTQMINLLLREIVEPVMKPYARFQQSNPQLVDVKTLALMATLPPYLDYIPPDFDLGAYLKASYLTPAMLGDNIVENHIQNGDWYMEQPDTEPPVTYNGVAFREPVQQAQYAANQFYNTHGAEVASVDKNGDIDTLLKYPGMSDFLKGWGNIPDLADPNAVGDQSPVNIWRYPTQFFKALQVLEEARKSNILGGVLGGGSSAYDYMGHLDDFKARHKACIVQQTARAANRAALKTIAGFFGVTPDKIKLKNKLESGRPAQFQVVR